MRSVDPTVTNNRPRGYRVARHFLHGAVLTLVGCSVLYELSADQCKTDGDCHALGGPFTDRVCRDGQCEDQEDASTGGTGGRGGTDGDSTTGAGSPGAGGEEPTGCTSNEECIDESGLDLPLICRDGECISLIDEQECPLVLSGEGSKSHPNLRKPNPIIFGAYSRIGTLADLALTQPTLNYELAINEINEELGGGLRGPDGDRQPFVAVICDGLSDNLDASMDHLINTLEVPAIITPLYTDDLLSVFESHARDSQTFLMSPFEADTTLTLADENGLMWHMLGSAEDLARGYVPLVARTEDYIRNVLGEGDKDLKVALVEADTPFLGDIADYVVENVEVNGEILVNQSDDTFQRFLIKSANEEGGADPEQIINAGEALNAWGPHIVLLIASEEVMVEDIFGSIEPFPSAYMSEHNQPLPFYLLSPYLFIPATADILKVERTLRTRMLGINFAAAADPTLYNGYFSRLKSVYDVDNLPFSMVGTENFYDAAYYLMYAIAAALAGNPNKLRGIHIAQNIERVLDLGSQLKFDVKPAHVANGMNAIYTNPDTTIALYGTLGPPDFNFSTGARKQLPSVFCTGEDAEGNFVLEPDVMTYDEGDDSLSADPPPCVPDF